MRSEASSFVKWAVALCILAVILLKGDASALRQLGTARIGPLGLAFICSVLVILGSCLKWRLVVRHLYPGAAPSWGRLFYYSALARLTGMVVPMPVGDMGVRALSLRVGHQVPMVGAGYTVYMERSFDLLAMLLSTVPALLFLTGAQNSSEATILYVVVVVAVTVLLLWRPLLVVDGLDGVFSVGRRLLARFPSLSRRLSLGESYDDEIPRLPARSAFILYITSLLILWLMTLRFYFLLVAVGVPIDFISLYFCVVIGQIIFVMAFTPGGLGIMEAGWYGLFALIDLPGDQTMLAVVSARAYTVAAAAVMASMGWLLIHVPRGEHRET